MSSSSPNPPPPVPRPEPIKFADEAMQRSRRNNRKKYLAATGPQSTVLTGTNGASGTALTGATTLGG